MSHPSWVCGLKHRLYDGTGIDVTSHPSWVCGLKPLWITQSEGHSPSHPSWVCGLKQGDWYWWYWTYRHTLRGCVDWNLFGLSQMVEKIQSHPSWVCGLKLVKKLLGGFTRTSHPSWVCGLKPIIILFFCYKIFVTPFVGVWIETYPVVNVIRHHIVTPFVGVWIETPIWCSK